MLLAVQFFRSALEDQGHQSSANHDIGTRSQYLCCQVTFGEQWYQAVQLPDMFTTRYVDKWTITGWKKEPLKLFGYSDVFNAHYILNHEGVMKWGRWFDLEDNMVEVTPELLQQYPLLRE